MNMRRRWWVAGIGMLVVGAIGVGVWSLSRSPSLEWTAEEIEAEQRAWLEASMPPGDAAWPLLNEAIARADEIAAAWPESMSSGWAILLEPLRRFDWHDPRLDAGKDAFAELSPVIALSVEASQRRRLFTDGDQAAGEHAFFDPAFPGPNPAAQVSGLVRILIVDGRRALGAGDQAGFVDRIETAVRLADVASQTPLLLSRSSVSLIRSLVLQAIIDGVREAVLTRQTCASLRSLVFEIRESALQPDRALFEGERLWTYAEAQRQLERALAMSIQDRLLLRLRVFRNGSGSLTMLEEYDWAWLEWLTSNSSEEIRQQIDAEAVVMTAWWNTPTPERSEAPVSATTFPELSYMESTELIANTRGGIDIVAARAVGVAVLLFVEEHHSATGTWPASLDELPEAATLRDPVSRQPLVYSADATEGWPFTLRLAIDDETMARLQPLLTRLLDDDPELTDNRLITRPAWVLPDDRLEDYPWLEKATAN